MNKAWLGYVSSALLLLAGIMMILGHKTAVGCLLIALSVLGLVRKLYMQKK